MRRRLGSYVHKHPTMVPDRCLQAGFCPSTVEGVLARALHAKVTRSTIFDRFASGAKRLGRSDVMSLCVNEHVKDDHRSSEIGDRANSCDTLVCFDLGTNGFNMTVETVNIVRPRHAARQAKLE